MITSTVTRLSESRSPLHSRFERPPKKARRWLAMMVVTIFALGPGLFVSTDPVMAATVPAPLATAANSGTNTWGSPQLIDPDRGHVTSVSCPTPSFCAAVDEAGYALTWDGSTWSSPAAIDVANAVSGRNLDSVSCPTASFCMAMDQVGTVFTWNGEGWSSAQQAGGGLSLVSCPTSSFCMAAGDDSAATWNGQAWSASQIGSVAELTWLSCPSTTFCAVVGVALDKTANVALTWGGSTWSSPADIGQLTDLYGSPSVSCPTPTFCMAAEIDNDGIGQDSTWNGLDWSPPVNTPYQAQGGVECATPTSCVIVNLGLQMMTWNGSTWSTSSNSGGYVNDVGFIASCPLASFCVILSGNGQAYTWDGSSLSSPVEMDPPFGYLRSVSCPTSTFCAAVDQNGNAVTWNGVTWSYPVSVDPDYSALFAVSCASATFCMAATTDAFTWDGSTWSGPINLSANDITALACLTSTFCAAVDDAGNAYIWNGSTWSGPTNIDDSGIADLSCPTSTFCAAVDDAGNAITWDGSTWSGPTSIDPSSPGIVSISCPEAGFCMVVDYAGHSLTWDGSLWSAPVNVGFTGSTSISCADSTFCIVIGVNGTWTWDGSSWAGPVNIYASAVSCARIVYCVAVDGGGNAYVYGETTYVALGDSYSSGESVRPFLSQSPACDQSIYAYPELAYQQLLAIPNLQFVACTGATTKDVTTTGQFGNLAQVDSLSPSDSLVTITVGGDDPAVDFASVLGECVEQDFAPELALLKGQLLPDGSCVDNPGFEQSVLSKISSSTLQTELVGTFTDIEGRVGPGTRIVALDYPDFFPTSVPVGCVIGLTSADSAFFNQVGNLLDQVEQHAAAAAGVDFVDVRRAFAGHGLCSSDPYMNALLLDHLQTESFHPNASGQAAYASALLAHLSQTSFSSAGTNAAPAVAVNSHAAAANGTEQTARNLEPAVHPAVTTDQTGTLTNFGDLSLTPPSGAPADFCPGWFDAGETLSIAGGLFEPGSTAQLSLTAVQDGTATTIELGEATADSTGEFSTTASVPSNVSGIPVSGLGTTGLAFIDATGPSVTTGEVQDDDAMIGLAPSNASCPAQPAVTLGIVANTPAPAIVGTPYLGDVAASGGTGPYEWAIIAGALPSGLSFNRATGAITGTPTEPGTSAFEVQATDSTTPTPTTATMEISLGVVAADAVPRVTSLSVLSASPAGGTPITITGAGLAGATAVNFGLVPAASFTVVSPSEIDAVSPVQVPGTVDVTVTTASGTSVTSAEDQFTFTSSTSPVMTVASSANPSTYGQSVTFTATVSPDDGGGTVAFYGDGSTTPISGCGAETLNLVGGNWQAACSTSLLPVGSDTVSATYSGDTSYPSVSGSLPGDQQVNQAPTTVPTSTTSTTRPPTKRRCPPPYSRLRHRQPPGRWCPPPTTTSSTSSTTTTVPTSTTSSTTTSVPAATPPAVPTSTTTTEPPTTTSTTLFATTTTVPRTTGRHSPRVVLESYLAKTSGAYLAIRLSCEGSTCSGNGRLTELKIDNGKTAVLAAGAYTLKVGIVATVDLLLTPTGSRLLARAESHPLREGITVFVHGGNKITATLLVS